MSNKKFMFVVEVGISMNIEVDAKTLEAAIKIAKDSPVMSLCHQCARGDPGEWCTSGELDGDPASGELVQATIDGEEQPINTVKKKWGSV